VHPLEALYKRPAPITTTTTTTTTIETKPPAPSFSFFGADENEDIDMEESDAKGDDEVKPPMTPYTQRDFEWRGLRSAAPTPDTAHGNKRFIWPVKDDSASPSASPSLASEAPSKNAKKGNKRDQIKGGMEEDGKNGDGESKEEQSEFQKWFYEHRGEANRAWKKRRKVVGKEKRQRENRKRDNRV
jgi:hypothetical protein